MKKDPNHWERYREIGFRIAYCRKYQKMTQEELAEKLNIEPKYFLEFQNFPFQKAPETDSNSEE